jgi:phosphoglycerate dehydrogenase-like enzyme
MVGLLVAQPFLERFGDGLRAAAEAAGIDLDHIVLPLAEDATLPPDDLARVEVALFSDDFFVNYPAFFRTAKAAPNLRWLHVATAGVDGPLFAGFIERGVRLTSSTGANAEPIAHSAIAGLLAIERGFTHFMANQREHRWEWLPDDQTPRDLRGQVMVVVGLGSIGKHIARLAKAFEMHVIGIRRSPRRDDDPVDELHPPAALLDVLPRCDWLVVATPLTPETERMIGAREFAALPRGARFLNVGRGAVVDEAALIDALQSGQLSGAYLDVFETEPLPADSPLWDMPRVIISPHQSSRSRGNAGRVAAIFFDNLPRYARGEPMVNEVGGT